MCLDCKQLNPAEELRRFFGSAVVTNQVSSIPNSAFVNASAAQKRAMARYQPKPMRSNIIQPRFNWPPSSVKLGMDMIIEHAAVPGVSEAVWTFTHSRPYKEIQYQFLQCVESMGKRTLVRLVVPIYIDCRSQHPHRSVASVSLSCGYTSSTRRSRSSAR